MKRATKSTRSARGNHAQGARDERHVADRVKLQMKQLGLDGATLATRMGLEEDEVARFLKGEPVWSLKLLSRFAAALEVPEKELDPSYDPSVLNALSELQLRKDIPHLQALYAFIRSLPQIRETEDLLALERILQRFAAAPAASGEQA